MTWGATVTAIQKNQGNVVVSITFQESVTLETISVQVPGQNFTPLSLATYCQNYIAGLQTRDAAAAALAVGPVVLPGVSKDPAVIAAVAAAAAANNYFALVAQYNALQVQVTLGILQANDPSIATAAAAVKAAFLPAYTSDPRFGA
jgi:hypothetical protein